MFLKIGTGVLLASLFFAQGFAIYDPDAPSNECAEGQMCIMTLSTMPAPIMQSSYATSGAFLESEGQICESATDGVNTFFIDNATLGGSTRMGYPEDFSAQWKCLQYLTDEMMYWSENDRNQFNSLLENTPESQKKQVGNTVIKVETFLGEKPKAMEEQYMDAVLELIDTHKMKIMLSYPQDIALPQEVSNIYNMLTLLRFTLMTL